MAEYGNPRNAVVSIWHRAQATDEFLGSGAFIASDLVLTAKHLLQDTPPEAIQLRLVDGYNHITPHTFRCHDTLDIAVIDLGRAFPNQQVARLDYRRSGLEGTTVDIYGVNPDSKHRDECRGYTIGTWYDKQHSYLFDHAQRKGFSGGMVVHNGNVIGIMTRRHQTEQQGEMLPLAAAADWLQGVFPVEVLAPTTLPISVPAELTQHGFTRHVRQKVGKLLERQSLRPLRAHLLAHAAGDEAGDKPENVLIPLDETFSIESSIHALRQATRACQQQLAEQGADAVQAMIAGALDVFGWLVLLTVSESWVESQLGVQERAAGQETLLQLLRCDLPHLGAFLIGLETGEQVLVMNETRLRSLTREFLRALQDA